MYSVRWVRSTQDISEDLWTDCFPPPLEGHWWYRALERSGLENQFSFAYAILQRGHESVGIAPTFLMDVPIDLVAPPALARLLRLVGSVFPRVRYQRTLFVGSPCSDEGTVGLLPGADLAGVAPILHDALLIRAAHHSASLVVWKDFPQAASASLELLCAQRGLFKIVSYPGTRLPLAAGGFEAYLQMLTSSHRHNLRKKLRRSKALGDLHAMVVQRPDPPLLDEIFALFRQTYERAKTKFERLTPQFFQLMAAEDVSHFIALRFPETGRLAAFMLCFRIGCRVINKFIGLDYSLDRQWYLYFRLWEHAIEWASRSGATEFQSGQTGYRAKLDLEHRLIPLHNYCRHRHPAWHRLFARTARDVSWSSLDEDLAAHSIERAEPER
jgi:hypothetical protein